MGENKTKFGKSTNFWNIVYVISVMKPATSHVRDRRFFGHVPNFVQEVKTAASELPTLTLFGWIAAYKSETSIPQISKQIQRTFLNILAPFISLHTFQKASYKAAL